MKYNVQVEFLYHTTVEVEADTPEEAVELTNKLSCNAICGGETIPASDLEDGEITEVYNEDWDVVKYL